MESVRNARAELPADSWPRVEHEIDLRAYAAALWRWKIIILCGVLAGAAVALVITHVSLRMYRATAVLRVVQGRQTGTAIGELKRRFTAVVKRPEALAAAAEQFKLATAPSHLTAGDLDRLTQVGVQADGPFVTVSVDLPDARLAADVANFMADRARTVNNGNDEWLPTEVRTLLEKREREAAARLAEAETARARFVSDSGIDRRRDELRMLRRRGRDLDALRLRLTLSAADGAPGRGAEIGAGTHTAEIERLTDDNRKAVEAVRSELDAKAAQLRQLTAGYEDAQFRYRIEREQLARAQLEVALGALLLTPVTPAAPPPQPLSNTAKYAVLGGVAGGIAMPLLALMINLVGSSLAGGTEAGEA